MRRPAVAAALAAATLLVAACSAPSTERKPSDDVPPSTPTAHGSYSECLRAHGVSHSAGPISAAGPPAGVSPAAWEQAMRACATLAPGPPGP